MIQDVNLQKVRQKLEEELDQLLMHMDDNRANRGQHSGDNLDRDDLAHNYVLQERRFALRDVEKVQVAQIKEALARIVNGTYGTCAGCGENISPGRLEIIPYAALCIRCQQAQDQN